MVYGYIKFKSDVDPKGDKKGVPFDLGHEDPSPPNPYRIRRWRLGVHVKLKSKDGSHLP